MTITSRTIDPRSFIFARLSADQTTGLAIGNRVQFNTATQFGIAITLDTVTNVGQFTLRGPGTFQLMGGVGVQTTQFCYIGWFDVTGSIISSSIGTCLVTGSSNSQCPIAMGLVTLTAAQTKVFEVRNITSGGTFTAIDANYTWAMVRRV